MPLMFHDVRLPEDIEQGAVGGPSFYTNVTSQSSGSEQRIALWDRQRLKWQVGYGIQEKADYQALIAFYYARRGKAYGFRFRDFSDYSVEDAIIGTGDGANRVFRLTKTYEPGGALPYVRVITHPVIDDNFEVKANGVTVDPSTYSVEDFGVLRFHVGQAPANGVIVTWTGLFDVPVRFDVDEFQLTVGALAAGEVSNNPLPIIEIREQINNPPTDILATTVYHSALNEDANVATRTAILDFEIVDDDLGVNDVSLTGTHPLFFEAELNAGTRSGTLYLRAGVTLHHDTIATLSVDINTWDTVVGDRPSASLNVLLNITDVAEPPVVTLSNEVHGILAGASTAARTKLADIDYTVDLGQSVALTLTGADASHFEIFGGDLYLKSGEDTASVHHYDVNIVATPSVAAATVVPFTLTIGIVASTTTYDTPGTYTFNVTEYASLEIDVWAAGCASWGYTPGTPVPPTAPGRTYVQNDQTVTLFHRWRVEPFRMTDNPDAWTPGYKVATAVMDSLGVGAALTATNPGNVGGAGIPLATRETGYDQPSGAGGHQLLLDSSVVLGGAGVRAAAPTDDTATTANGASGTAPGTGASGGVYKKRSAAVGVILPGSGTLPAATLEFTAMAGAGSGHFAKQVWTYGSAQVGSGAGYTAPAPAVGDVLTIVIGTGGVKGSGTVNGGDGQHGRVTIKVS
jgi:uncharacterized protein (TIGR02217 family)